MTDAWSGEKGIISHLRVRAAGLDPLATRARLTTLLAGMTLQPSHLPPAAIFIIRTLPDPLPGRVSLDGGHFRAPPAWERAVTTILDQMAQEAARPALGAVPANAAAVVFGDRAEWLACLASDWCAGTVLLHWWWQTVIRHTAVTEAVKTAWLESPAYLPSALGHLATHHQVVPFVRRLGEETADTLLQGMVHFFALPGLSTVFKPIPAKPEIRPKPPPHLQIRDDIPTQTIPGETQAGITTPLAASPPVAVLPPGQTAVSPPPWLLWVPESADPSLSSIQQLLLGVGLLLQRKPAIPHTPAFLQAVQQWWQTAVSPTPPPPPPLSVSSGQTATPGLADSVHPAFHDTAPPNITKTERPFPITTNLTETSPLPPSLLPQTAESTPTPSPKQPQVVHSLTLPPPVTRPEATLETAWGGLFYLVNVGLALGLYSDFTTPSQSGISLPIWDFLALLGQELVEEAIQSDPVWSLLAQLSGRSAPNDFDNLEDLFELPTEWRLPAAWLTAFPEPGIWRYATRQGRLCVLHPAGFQILDLPAVHHSLLTEETRPYASLCSFTLQPGPLLDEPADLLPLQRWLNWLMPYVRARLARALGETVNFPHLLCHQYARLYLTDTHLDIFLSLDELPIAIRLAGLDRDPGWVPAAGRYIKFHFE